MGAARVTLGPSASDQWLHAPEHLAMVFARYRAAAALVGTASSVLEVGCGEGIGLLSLALHPRQRMYCGIDPDAGAIAVAAELYPPDLFLPMAVEQIEERYGGLGFDAAVALDVIEHVRDGAAFLDAIVRHLTPHGVCVIGTPSAAFDHLASAPSRAAHVVTYTHDRLHALMAERFRVVQSFGLQDTALHLGHPEARHYLLMCGIGVR